MRLRGLAVLVSSLYFLTTPATASAPRRAMRMAAETLTAMPSANLPKPLRTERDLKWSRPTSAAWHKLASTGAWHAAWDRATGVPTRIWGSGTPAPGAMASDALAAGWARAALAEHLALLAPGASLADFTLVANQVDDDIRSVGFVQRAGGRIVVGGQVSFRFKRDRLFVIASEALPDVVVPAVANVARSSARMAPIALHAVATTTLRSALALPDAPVSAPGDEVILPLVADDSVLGYRLAVPVTIDGGADGRYLAYCDPATGEPIAVRQLNMYAAGKLLYRAVVRYPERPRRNLPVPLAHIEIAGSRQTTSAEGDVSWPDDAVRTLSTSVVGDLVAIFNRAEGGTRATTDLRIIPEGTAIWDASESVEDDAQVQAYLNVNRAKAFARALDPEMRTLDDQIIANVNIPQDCNAFYDGRTVNFFRASTMCQNSALLEDVVYHEYGHAFHTLQIIEGVGSFDGAMSEGAADYFAAAITGDPGMGRGFFYNDNPLRHLDPPNFENRWPRDLGEIHKTGIIFGGTFWDLRKALIDKLGEGPGIALTHKLYIAALRRSTGIPSSLIEVLAADDNDGDLSNGTPNECAIRDAYSLHGLRTASGRVAAPDRLSQPIRRTTVHIDLTGLSERCDGDEVKHTELAWKPFGATGPAAGSALAAQVPGDATRYSAELPVALDDKVLYQVRVVFADDSVLTLPDNLGDPYYELYDGRIIPLYCTDFEDGDPFADGWTTGTTDAGESPWVWGTPKAGASDPHAAYSGNRVLAQKLDGNYAPKSYSFVRMPPIEVGAWSDVHLQYRRWLTVEDSHYDQARITVADQPVWVNFTQNAGDGSATHHLDREWRFTDIALSSQLVGHTLDVAWDLRSDEGLHFGGWTLDDVCVVANANSVCGDGALTGPETCDEGGDNADRPNTCRTWCQVPRCGDGIIDDREECDGGPGGSFTCTDECDRIEPQGLGGCCSAQRGEGAGSAFALGALVLGGLLRRRRRW